MHWPPLTLPLPLESIIGTATACAPTPTRVQIATDADMMMIRCQLDDGWGQPVLRTVHGTHSTLYFAIRVPCWGDLNSRTTQTRSNIISSVTLIKHSKALSLTLALSFPPTIPPAPPPALGVPTWKSQSALKNCNGYFRCRMTFPSALHEPIFLVL